jgi:hypothetical protein
VADQPKKKALSAKNPNTDRRNRKAFKQDRGALRTTRNPYRGSHTRHVPLTELQKALLGGGAMRRITKPLKQGDEKPLVGA